MKQASMLLLAMTSITGGLQAQEVKVDSARTVLTWIGKKVAGQHNGTINLKSGSLILNGEQITGGIFVIDMNSIVNVDITDGATNQKLIGHLKSDDFFGVEKFPEATLVIKKATAFEDGKARITGELTIKGITQPTEFDVVKDGDSYRASVTVDRSKYNVRYGSKTFFDSLGDKVIYDNFEIGVELVLKN